MNETSKPPYHELTTFTEEQLVDYLRLLVQLNSQTKTIEQEIAATQAELARRRVAAYTPEAD